ncbi:TonB-dependent receptor [Ochrovirga pacifica]|uniref:TonB-dependent receptor n=1 Tax=Ochrovirga pacifica TaxID=1042376 RepID=UPI000255A7A8|nr:TonB-dependent receptor [Ochrovirga pacifica]
MKQLQLFTFAFLFSLFAFGQTKISGKVTDSHQQPLAFVSIFLKGTYEGTTTDVNGEFEFVTQKKGKQILVVSNLGFDSKELQKKVSELQNLQVVLKENVNSLNAVVLSAGTFSAGEKSKTTTLKPLDIVTTAGSLADPIAAFQTMPGTSTVAEDGRLFVRGGRAEETQIFIDGIRVFTPYVATTNNAPTRGRYSPFLFKGISFSTGGYSAEYGQALSGILLMNTIDEPENERTDISVMSLGVGLGNTQVWDGSSLTVNTSYINLGPYTELYTDSNQWNKPYEAFAGESVYRKKVTKGLFKFYAAFDAARFDITQTHINYPDGLNFKTDATNAYANSSYRHKINKNWSTFYGISYTLANTKSFINSDKIDNTQQAVHAKVKANYKVGSFYKLNFGIESFLQKFDEIFITPIQSYSYGFNNRIFASYQESSFLFSKKFIAQLGNRFSWNNLSHSLQTDYRLSLAYKLGNKGQLSLATGTFHQNPEKEVLKFTQNIHSESSEQYIVNYQRNQKGMLFRVEGFYKKYKDLIKYNTVTPQFTSQYNNKGKGFARGVDVFWRDNKGIKNLDYWLSYSFLDTQRDFKNYSGSFQPSFVNKHNASVVTKYWMENWKSQLGLTYRFASGRTYTNPNISGFLNEKTKAFQTLDFNWAYLISPQKILFFSASNLLGTKNINGYQYANTPNAKGIFQREAIRPSADRFFFVGFFWTLSKKETDNQLNQL